MTTYMSPAPVLADHDDLRVIQGEHGVFFAAYGDRRRWSAHTSYAQAVNALLDSQVACDGLADTQVEVVTQRVGRAA